MNTYQATTIATRASIKSPAQPITLGKTYRTREFMDQSSEVRIFMTDGGTDKPVVGVWRVLAEDGEEYWQSGRWTAEGRWHLPGDDPEPGRCCLDLVEVDPSHVVALTTAGYTLTNMGGNITAWRLKFGAGELLITDDDDGTWTVMLYGDQHSEPLADLSGVTLADAIEAGGVFRLRASGCNA
jgi:hypothetical protein